MDTFAWPLGCLPVPVLAGRFPLADRGFATRYRGQTHALHLHGYHAAMRLAGRTVTLQPGDITISPAEQASSYDLKGAGRHWCIHFEPVASAGEAVGLPLHLSLGSAAGAAEEQFAHIGRLISANSMRDHVRASLALQELLLWIDERRGAPSGRTSMAERAAALIDDRFHQSLAVPDIVAALGVSQGHLARSFRKRFGVTLPHRLLQRRMAHARYLLESTDLPIWRVAERVGIPDPQHFNKSVRRFLGESPSAIRGRSSAMSPIDPDR